MRIDIVIYPGFDELDAIAPFEVFKNAALAGADFDVRLVSSRGAGDVVASHGLKVMCSDAWGEGPVADVVIIPGGGWIDGSQAGARAEAARGDIPARLAQLHEAGVTIAAVCTGAMLLATAGLLRGRPAVTHHGAIDDLRAAGAEIIDARVVDDGDIITAGGVTSGLDLALWLVERFASPAIAHAIERQMEYKRRDGVWRG